MASRYSLLASKILSAILPLSLMASETSWGVFSRFCPWTCFLTTVDNMDATSLFFEPSLSGLSIKLLRICTIWPFASDRLFKGFMIFPGFFRMIFSWGWLWIWTKSWLLSWPCSWNWVLILLFTNWFVKLFPWRPVLSLLLKKFSICSTCPSSVWKLFSLLGFWFAFSNFLTLCSSTMELLLTELSPPKGCWRLLAFTSLSLSPCWITLTPFVVSVLFCVLILFSSRFSYNIFSWRLGVLCVSLLLSLCSWTFSTFIPTSVSCVLILFPDGLSDAVCAVVPFLCEEKTFSCACLDRELCDDWAVVWEISSSWWGELLWIDCVWGNVIKGLINWFGDPRMPFITCGSATGSDESVVKVTCKSPLSLVIWEPWLSWCSPSLDSFFCFDSELFPAIL